MDDLDGQIVSFFFRHVVPIKITVEKGEDKVTKFRTAFLLSVKEYWFLITAGHIIKSIDEALDQGYRITEFQLIDFLGENAKNSSPIPFVYDRNSNSYYDDGEIDFGVIPLSQYYISLLKVNNLMPLSEEVWKHQPSAPTIYLLIGIPEVLEQRENGSIIIAPVMIGVEKVDEKPEGFGYTDYPLFYGKLSLPPDLPDIDGMSGGPILAIQKDNQGQARYWVVALQSSWLPETHYIKAFPTYVLGKMLEEFIQNLNVEH